MLPPERFRQPPKGIPMIKKAIVSSILLVVLCPAYGSPGEPSCVSTVANKYMSSISGGGNVSPSKIIKLQKSEYAVIYSDIPTGSAIGANGNVGLQFIDVKTSAILGECYVSVSRSTPMIQFSEWPIVKYISTSKNSMVVDIREYGPNDPMACMSYVYQETLSRNGHHNWIVKNKKFLSKGGC